ncbi:hypothetical protein D1872_229730 [compost metagenome]
MLADDDSGGSAAILQGGLNVFSGHQRVQEGRSVGIAGTEGFEHFASVSFAAVYLACLRISIGAVNAMFDDDEPGLMIKQMTDGMFIVAFAAVHHIELVAGSDNHLGLFGNQGVVDRSFLKRLPRIAAVIQFKNDLDLMFFRIGDRLEHRLAGRALGQGRTRNQQGFGLADIVLVHFFRAQV